MASPSAIGSTTPNTGAFTTLSFAPANNSTGFSNTGNSLTGSNAQSLISLAQTWNTTGTPAAFKLNVTDTASNASSLLMDLQVGGSSRFSISKSGLVTTSNQFARSNSAFGIASNGADFEFSSFGTTRVFIRNTGHFESRQSGGGITWNFGSGTRLALVHEADHVLAQAVTTNAQTFRLYNTVTSATNFERLNFRWHRTNLFWMRRREAQAERSVASRSARPSPACLDFTGSRPSINPLR